MSLLKKINQQGWRYSFAIAFNRLMPLWLFRCRRFLIYELDANQLLALKQTSGPTGRSSDTQPVNQSNETSETIGSSGLSETRESAVLVSWCHSELEIEAVENLTFFGRAMSTGRCRAIQAKNKNDLVGGFWIGSDRFDESELGVRIELTAEQVWLFAAYVSRNFRGRGVYSEILTFVAQALSAENKAPSQLLVAVNPDNLNSHRIHGKLARRTVGKVLAIRCMGWSWCWTSGGLARDRTWTRQAKKSPIQLKVLN